jgi:hypothetical protein
LVGGGYQLRRDSAASALFSDDRVKALTSQKVPVRSGPRR